MSATKNRDYETIMVLRPELGEDGVDTLVEQLKEVLSKNEGEFLRTEKQGKRKLSFDAKGQARGNFVLFHYVGKGDLVAKIERVLRNSEACLRFLTTVNGPVEDLAKKRAEIEKNEKERAAKAAQREAPRSEAPRTEESAAAS